MNVEGCCAKDTLRSVLEKLPHGLGQPFLEAPVRVHCAGAFAANYQTVLYSLDETLRKCGLTAPGGTVCVETREPANGAIALYMTASDATRGPLLENAGPRIPCIPTWQDRVVCVRPRNADKPLLLPRHCLAPTTSSIDIVVGDTVDSLKSRFAETNGACPWGAAAAAPAGATLCPTPVPWDSLALCRPSLSI